MKPFVKGLIHADSLQAKITLLIIATLILFIRRSDSFINPQFWAEDGVIFFLQQYENGFSALALPYAGYFHLIPRLIAFFSESVFAYSVIPSVYVFSSYLITLFVISNIFSCRLNTDYKGLMALTLVLIPHSGNEVFLNVTNIQWFLCILLLLTAIKREPDLKFGNINKQYFIDYSIILLSGLTGPFLIFTFPLLFLKWFKVKNKYNSLLLLISFMIIIFQLYFLLSEPLKSNNISLFDINLFSRLIGIRLFGGLFFGSLAQNFNSYFSTILYFIVIIFLTFHSYK